MANKLLFPTTVLFLLCSSTCSATIYTVGDNGGWDISTDIDSWENDKTFAVGDTLVFQYSRYHSVDEVTKENYRGCNTTNALQSSSNGNTTISLTGPGERYFVCGNRLHCLAGMKLRVNVVENHVLSPVGPPEAQPGGNLPPGSTRTSNPSNSASCLGRIRMDSSIVAFFGSLAILFGVV